MQTRPGFSGQNTFHSKINFLLGNFFVFQCLLYRIKGRRHIHKMFPEGTANVKAILAGNDILETFVDVPAAFNAIKKALDNKEITQDEKKIFGELRAKSFEEINALFINTINF